MEVKDKTEEYPHPTISDPSGLFDYQLMRIFGITPENINSVDKKKLAELTDMLNGISDKPIERLQHIRALRARIGVPQIGQTDLDNVHKYMKLRAAAKEAEVEAEMMES